MTTLMALCLSLDVFAKKLNQKESDMGFNIPSANIDQFGYVTQSDGDGGDTLHRLGFIMIGNFILFKRGAISQAQYEADRDKYLSQLSQLECEGRPGVFKRHPDTSKWYGQCDRMSRDQITPNIIALGMVEPDRSILKRVLKSNAKRLMLFTTNTKGNSDKYGKMSWKLPDFTGPHVWAMYIRAFKIRALYPLLVLFDLESLVNNILMHYTYFKDPQNSDDVNNIAYLLQAHHSMPTPFSWLASKIYRRRPKAAAPRGGYKSDFGPQTALDHYFAPEFGGAPLNDLYRLFLEQEL